MQLAYLSALCVETALPQGGQISVRCEGDCLLVCAEGPAVAKDPDLWAILEDRSDHSNPPLRPAHVQFALLRVLMNGSGQDLSHKDTENSISVRITLPGGTGDAGL